MYISKQTGDTGIFVPRVTDPAVDSSGSPYWTKGSAGGYGKNWGGTNPPWTNSTLYNCTSYAWGRLLEILNTSFSTQFNADMFDCFLYGNGEDWYRMGSQYGWSVSPRPVLGGLMCWTASDYEGHIAIVEKVEADGSVWTSEGSYYQGNFSYRRRYDDGHWGQGSTALFQGCLYLFRLEGEAPPPTPVRTKKLPLWMMLRNPYLYRKE